MKRLMLAGLLAPLAFAAAAQVDTPKTPSPAVTGAAQVETALEPRTSDERRAGAETAVERDARRDCMRYTGSRVVATRNRGAGKAKAEAVDELDRDDCVAANGRVYSRDDLDRTGATDIADALRRLDPSIR